MEQAGKAENGLDYSVTVEKAKECAKLATVALFSYSDCLSKVGVAFSRVEEELCDEDSRQTSITWEMVLKYWDNLFRVALKLVCAARCIIVTYCTYRLVS